MTVYELSYTGTLYMYLLVGLSLAAASLVSLGCYSPGVTAVAESAVVTSWVELVALLGGCCVLVGDSLTRDS